eukprot:jgi/Chrzof1/6982/Cz02g06140.t1
MAKYLPTGTHVQVGPCQHSRAQQQQQWHKQQQEQQAQPWPEQHFNQIKSNTSHVKGSNKRHQWQQDVQHVHLQRHRKQQGPQQHPQQQQQQQHTEDHTDCQVLFKTSHDPSDCQTQAACNVRAMHAATDSVPFGARRLQQVGTLQPTDIFGVPWFAGTEGSGTPATGPTNIFNWLRPPSLAQMPQPKAIATTAPASRAQRNRTVSAAPSTASTTKGVFTSSTAKNTTSTSVVVLGGSSSSRSSSRNSSSTIASSSSIRAGQNNAITAKLSTSQPKSKVTKMSAQPSASDKSSTKPAVPIRPGSAPTPASVLKTRSAFQAGSPSKLWLSSSPGLTVKQSWLSSSPGFTVKPSMKPVNSTTHSNGTLTLQQNTNSSSNTVQNNDTSLSSSGNRNPTSTPSASIRPSAPPPSPPGNDSLVGRHAYL